MCHCQMDMHTRLNLSDLHSLQQILVLARDGDKTAHLLLFFFRKKHLFRKRGVNKSEFIYYASGFKSCKGMF